MYLLPFSCSYFTLRFHYLLLEVPIYFGAAHLRPFTEEDGGEPYDPGCWRGKVQDWDGAGLVVVLIHLKYEKNREDIGLFGI